MTEMTRFFTVIILTISTGFILGCSDNSGSKDAGIDNAQDDSGGVFPETEWQVVEAEQEGFDPEVLKDVADWVESKNSSCFVVTRHGVIVGEWYWNDWDKSSVDETFSITKSFTSALVGIAQGRGDLNVDESASKYIEQWKGTESEAVTIKNLISNDSGRYWDYESEYIKSTGIADVTGHAIELPEIEHPQQHIPGEFWQYNNTAIQTLERVLKQATGTDVIAFAEEHLLQPIGINATLARDQAGNPLVISGLHASCRDLARFGYLYMMQGRWSDGKQVVPQQWVRDSLKPSTDLNSAYGYLWWLNQPGDWVCFSAPERVTGSGNYFGDVPEDVFAAMGMFSQLIVVVPSEGIVLTRLGSNAEPEQMAFNRLIVSRTLSALEGAEEPYHFEIAETTDGGSVQVYETVMPELESTEECISFFINDLGSHVPPDSPRYPSCPACSCENCLSFVNDCRTEAGCMDVIYCAIETECNFVGCYAPDTCQHILDSIPGGVMGDASKASSAWTECAQSACEGLCR